MNKNPSAEYIECYGALVHPVEQSGRITREQVDQVIQDFAALNIALIPLDWSAMLPLSRRFGCIAYNVACLTSTEQLDEHFVTADPRLCNAVHLALNWVLWLGDYPHDE